MTSRLPKLKLHNTKNATWIANIDVLGESPTRLGRVFQASTTTYVCAPRMMCVLIMMAMGRTVQKKSSSMTCIPKQVLGTPPLIRRGGIRGIITGSNVTTFGGFTAP